MVDRAEALKMQSILQEEVKKLQEVQKKIQKLSAPRGAYLTQLTENEAVLAELKLLSEDDKVYKLMGPVLVLQELETSKSQVQNRISFFKKNLKAIETQTTDLTKKQVEIRQKVQGMQQVMITAQRQAIDQKLKQKPGGV
ncbi:hypothetical protein AAMO2058_000276700 [Amorphochlora amoebiformis]